MSGNLLYAPRMYAAMRETRCRLSLRKKKTEKPVSKMNVVPSEKLS